MRKLRVILSALAIVFAFGGAVASALLPNSVAYEYVTNPEPDCLSRTITCQSTPTMHPCRTVAGGPILKDSPDFSTQCGNDLWRTTAP